METSNGGDGCRLVGIGTVGQGLRTGTQSSGLQLLPGKLDHKFKRDYCFAASKRIENSFFFTLD